MTIYLLGAFLVSLICGLVFTPLILDFCKRKRLYDIPNERKIHKNAIPRLGGISFFPSMLTAFFIVLLFTPVVDQDTLPVNIWSAVFLIGLLLIYGIGIIDDLVGLNATTKFVVQIATASLLPFAGLYINNLYGLFGIHEIPYWFGVPLTVFIIVFIDNAINLIDGIDGLAASLSLLALAGFLTYFNYYNVYVYTYTIIIAGMMGALVAFAYFNLFGKSERNNKIFMGDSGSLSLGFTLGFLAVKCTMDNQSIWPYRPEAIIVPLSLLFVPTADVVRVTLFRLRHHKPLFDADKNHIHHKLMRAGLNQHQTLVCIIILAACNIAINWLLYMVLPITVIVIADILLYCIVNLCINRQLKIEENMKKSILMMLAIMFLGTAGYAKSNVAEDKSKSADGVEAVDLGLSVKWANMNVGAKKASGFGTYYAWGETKPKEYYSWNTYIWSRGDSQFLTKYSTTDRRSQLVPQDDAAHTNWGGEWRMPTVDEFEELVNPDNCTWEWTTQDGVNGYKVTGKKTGNSIFLPITGFRFYANTQFRAISGIYWTSSLYTSNPNKAWCLEFNFSNIDVHYGDLSSNRFSGRCIRAVK